MILQKLTEEELNAFDQMARTTPELQTLIDFILKCMNTGALQACYSGGDEQKKLSGAVIAFRDLAGLLITAKSSKEEVANAMAMANNLRDRDLITP